jgi:anti-sigma factor RsiW
MSACDNDALSRFVDGELSPERYRQVAYHLRECSRCRAQLVEMRKVTQILQRWGNVRVPVPVHTEQRVRGTVERRRRFAPLFALSRMTPAAVGSTIAALLVLVTVNLNGAYPGVHTQAQTSADRKTLQQQSRPLLYARAKSAVIGDRTDTVTPAQERHRLPLNSN